MRLISKKTLLDLFKRTESGYTIAELVRLSKNCRSYIKKLLDELVGENKLTKSRTGRIKIYEIQATTEKGKGRAIF